MNDLIDWLAQRKKAIAAGAAPIVVKAVSAVLGRFNIHTDALDLGTTTALIAAVIGAAATYQLRNKPTKPTPTEGT